MLCLFGGIITPRDFRYKRPIDKNFRHGHVNFSPISTTHWVYLPHLPDCPRLPYLPYSPFRPCLAYSHHIPYFPSFTISIDALAHFVQTKNEALGIYHGVGPEAWRTSIVALIPASFHRNHQCQSYYDFNRFAFAIPAEAYHRSFSYPQFGESFRSIHRRVQSSCECAIARH